MIDEEPQSKDEQHRARRARSKALRTAHQARRTWIALLFFPVFIIYLMLDAARDMRDYLGRIRKKQLAKKPRFKRPENMPAPDRRSMKEIVSVLEKVPFRPKKLSTSAAFFKDNGPDAIGSLLSNNPHVAAIAHSYPSTFQERLFTGADGVQLSGMEAMQEHRGPAVVICHGLLMMKNFDAIIQMARRAYEQWGFHVVTLDLRGWGASSWTTEAPSSAGYHEGRDIVEICRTLHKDPRVTSVGAIGFSLGGACVLNAARFSSLSEDKPLDGGAVTLSAPTDIAVALKHISKTPHWRDPFFGLFQVFRATIKDTVRRRGLSHEIRTWYELVKAVAAPYYEVDMDTLAYQASATKFVDDIKMPVLDLHAADDFLVPVEHAFLLKDAAVDNPLVHVMIKTAGAHVAFNAVDSRWYHTMIRRWLEYWATPAEPTAKPREESVNVVVRNDHPARMI